MLISNSQTVPQSKDGHNVRQKVESFTSEAKIVELEQRGGRFFQDDRKRGQIDYLSLRWKGKSSSGFKF